MITDFPKPKRIWWEFRIANDPSWIGYIVEEKIKCGKPNCRCVTKNQKHFAYYLYWREYQLDGSRKLRKRYLKKSEVPGIQKILSSNKGALLMQNISDEQIIYMSNHFPPELEGNNLSSKFYNTFGASKNASRLMQLFK